jgi:hypothetical protein
LLKGYLSRALIALTLCLTSQPFSPKLRLTKHMHPVGSRLRSLALLLAVVFLAAQFHFCADLISGPTSSHVCPVCNAAGSAVATESPRATMNPITNRLESVALVSSVSCGISLAISPRAPPSL